MNEQEQRAFEQRAPTTLPTARHPPLSWDEELLLSAVEGDIPRMARALDHGANPEAVKDGCSVAYMYAYGRCDDALNLRYHFAASGINQDQTWAWLKARGLNLHVYTPRTLHINTRSVWSFLYSAQPHLAAPVDAKCAEINLWAVWKSASQKERRNILSFLDTNFSQGDSTSSSEAIQTLKGLPPFSSRIMKDVMDFEGLTRAVCGKPLSVFALQSRVLALSSLLGARDGLPLETRHGCSQDYMKLGLWAYAPATVFRDLLSLPFSRPLLIDCVTRAASTLQVFYEAQETQVLDAPHASLLARRLARGVRTLLQNGFDFPQETLNALLIVNEVRPLLEKRFLKEALDEKDSDLKDLASSRSRVRL